MTSAVSLIFQQKNPGPINEVYEKILFAGLDSRFFKQSKIRHGYVALTLKKTYKTDRNSQQLTEVAYNWHSIF